MFSAMRIAASCLLLIFALPLNADKNVEAYRLLKSWGMQFDASGKLHFRSQKDKADPSAERWNPDVSAFQSNKPQPVGETLQPLIISSKQATKK